eukprot:c24419_g1_i1 orf=500-982(-)
MASSLSSLPCLSSGIAPCGFHEMGHISERRTWVNPAFRPSSTRGMCILLSRQNNARKVNAPRSQIVSALDKSTGGLSGPKLVVMVDPLEAKRLAAEQMKQLQEQAKFKRRCKIEAINGGWAMFGLCIGIMIEGYTGKGIILQVAGYLDSLVRFLDQFIPS